MSAMESQITSFTIIYSMVYSGSCQRKHQSSVSLAFVRGIHRWPVNSPHKGPVSQKMFPSDDVIMNNWDQTPWSPLRHQTSSMVLKLPWVPVLDTPPHQCLCNQARFNIQIKKCIIPLPVEIEWWRSQLCVMWQKHRATFLPRVLTSYCKMQLLSEYKIQSTDVLTNRIN